MIKKDDLIDLDIIDLDHEGRGVAKVENEPVVFMKGAVPGDTVRAIISRVKKNYAEAKLTELIKPSERRTQPRCEHFGTCNGCKMQNLRYDAQLEIKKQQVINAFERVGGFSNIEIPDVLGCKDIYFYRNKLEFSFSNNRWLGEEDMKEGATDKSFALGYHMPKFVDKVLDIENCYLQSETSNQILNSTREFFKKRKASIYSFRTHEGYLRYLVVRNSSGTDDMMVNLITSNEDESLINAYAECLKEKMPAVTTLTNTIATTKAQAAIGDYFKTIFGKGFIEEQLDRYKFNITPNAFFQTNSRQAKVLFETAAAFAEFNGNENVLDLYCGSGAISIYVSGHVKSVTGVESNKEAVESAKENTDLNSVQNCEFITYDVKDYLKLLIDTNDKRYDVIILDPPRSGIHPKAADYLLELEPKKIIYVSCNPVTQARDLKVLSGKYEITKIQPVDMFPQTMHVENVVRLDLRK